jgi:hypothetical protein
VQDPVADQQAEGDEHHRLGHRRGRQPPRHGGVADQQQGDPGQPPLVHAPSTLGSSLDRLGVIGITRKG